MFSSNLMDHISRVLNKQGEVALDNSQAFDKVWHQELLTKLRSYGFSWQLPQFVASFLEDRQRSVVLDGQRYFTKCIIAGGSSGFYPRPPLIFRYTSMTFLMARLAKL